MNKDKVTENIKIKKKLLNTILVENKLIIKFYKRVLDAAKSNYAKTILRQSPNKVVQVRSMVKEYEKDSEELYTISSITL